MAQSAHDVRTPRVVLASVTDARLTIELDDGRSLSVPVEWYPRLGHGDARERSNWRLIGDGGGVHWPDLDEDVSVEGLLAGRRSAEGPRSLQQWIAGRRGSPSLP